MSIRLRNVQKFYNLQRGKHRVLHDINLEIRKGEKWGILGKNGAGKSTLIRLISGAELPSTGSIERQIRVSWPLGLTGGFQGSLTGVDNIKFISRIYDVDYQTIMDGVESFAELGKFLKEPVKTYSSGMLSRLAFGLSLAIEFDCFLIDEGIAVGDFRFHEKSNHELFEKRQDRAMVIVSHDASFIERHCDRLAVLRNGVLTIFQSKPSAFDFYFQN
jgi:capsular polysaccharide transport system ATP-binding protein